MKVNVAQCIKVYNRFIVEGSNMKRCECRCKIVQVKEFHLFQRDVTYKIYIGYITHTFNNMKRKYISTVRL
jgi:hypothetical protein